MTNLKITRAQSDPNIFQLSPIVKIAPLMVGGVQKNQLKITTSVAPYDTKVYTVDNGAATGVWSTISEMTGGLLNLSGSYDKSKTWLVKVSVSDSLNPASESTQSVSSEFVLICKAPKGVGVGKIWERGIADLNGDVFISGKTETKSLVVDGFAITKQIIFDIAHPVGEIFETNDPRNPNVYFGMGTWVRYGQGRVVDGFAITKQIIFDIAHPVGEIFETNDPRNPNVYFGMGTWVRYGQGRSLVGVNENDPDFATVGKTGGEKAHTQTVAEMATHAHGFRGGGENNYVRVESSSTYGYSGNSDKTTNASGGGQPFNVMHPYITAYMWLRTA